MNKTEKQNSAEILNKYKMFAPETVDLSTKESSVVLNASPRTLEKWRLKRKNLSFTRTPGGITYKLSDVLKFKDSLVINIAKEESNKI